MSSTLRRCFRLACLVLAFQFALISATSAYAQGRKRIAVMSFDDHLAGTQRINIGEKVSDGIISKVAGNGTFEVVDREHLARIVQEQNLKMDGRFDAAQGAKLGKLANVDVLIVGQIESFHADATAEKSPGFFTDTTRVTGQVTLKVTSRMISIETASIIAAPTSTSELTQVLSERKDVLASERGAFSSKTTGDSNSQAALLKLLDKSIEAVSTDLAKQIEGNASKIPGGARSGSAAKVIGIDAGLVLINRGSTAGIQAGQEFTIYRAVDTGLKDPDSGQPVIRKKKVCAMSISEVEDSVASGKCEGEQPVAGDEVRPTTGS
jgi:curli biogenesis system outer membrane secretion channel CsgG